MYSATTAARDSGASVEFVWCNRVCCGVRFVRPVLALDADQSCVAVAALAMVAVPLRLLPAARSCYGMLCGVCLIQSFAGNADGEHYDANGNFVSWRPCVDGGLIEMV